MNITWYTNTAQWSTIHDIRKPTKLIIQTKKKYVQKKNNSENETVKTEENNKPK